MTKCETYISRQARRLSKGQIDRRRFVMSALATGVTMPTAMSLASRAEAALPKRGGHLRFGVRSGFDIGSEGWLHLQRACGSRLVALAPDGAVTGDLAEAFECDASGRVWSFVLRPDVRFHSGKPVEAQDVAALLLAAGGSSRAARSVTSQIARIEAEGRDLRLTLHHPHFGFAALLADPHLTIRPSGAANPLDGTGLYRVLGHDPEGSVRLERNMEHWSESAGHFGTIELIPMPDARLRQNAIMTGEVDVIEAVDPRALALLATLPDVGIAETEGTGHIALDVLVPDARILDRLRSAIDRPALLERGLLGHGSVGADVPLRHDVASSREQPLGRSPRVTLAVDTSGVSGAEPLLEVLNEATSKAGITLHAVAPGEPASLALRQEHGTSCEDAALAACYLPDAGAAPIGFVQPNAGWHFAKHLQHARGTPEAELRDNAYAAARRLAAKHGTRLIPVWTNDLVAHSRQLTHVPEFSGAADITTRWWFA